MTSETFQCKFEVRSTEIIKCPDLLHSWIVTRDEKGKLISREKIFTHYVCMGYEHCFMCGKKLSDPVRKKQSFKIKFLNFIGAI